MKKWLLFLILLVSTSLYAQVRRDSVYLDLKLYQVVYSEVLEQPKMVHYYVECPNGTASRKGLDFVFYKGVHSSDSKDYADNPYDKGHMAPAASMSCDSQTIKATFYYINCALQHQDLNRGAWKDLEQFERNLAKVGQKVEVTIRVDFKGAKKLPTGATIPSGFWKTIRVNNTTYEFYFPNKTPERSDFMEYQTKCCQ